MATFNEIVYAVYNKIKTVASDDDTLSLDEVKFEVINARAQFIRNELNKNRTVDPSIVQSLGCMELEISDTSACCTVPTGCSILRTKLEVPKTIELHHTTGIEYVGPIGVAQAEFSYITEDQARYSGNGKYNKKHIYAFLNTDNKVYIFSKDLTYTKYLKYINIKGIFEDPRDVSVFNDCSTGDTCFSDDSRFPMSSYMISAIEADLLARFAPGLTLPVDESNDATYNPKPAN